MVPAGRGTRGSIPRPCGTEAASEVLDSKVGIWARRIPLTLPVPAFGGMPFPPVARSPACTRCNGAGWSHEQGALSPFVPLYGEQRGAAGVAGDAAGSAVSPLKGTGCLPPQWPRGCGAASSALSMCRCVEVAVVCVCLVLRPRRCLVAPVRLRSCEAGGHRPHVPM